MNAHDSERIKGMLESLGLGETLERDDADVLVFNTCTIREKPDTKLAAYLGEAAARKRRRPDVVVAVGGCYAEAQRDRIFELYPFVDVAFGPGSIPHLGEWIVAGGFADTERLEHSLDPLGVVGIHLAAECRDVVPAHRGSVARARLALSCGPVRAL